MSRGGHYAALEEPELFAFLSKERIQRSVKGMIQELALLHIRPGQTAEFEAAFAGAQRIIASMKGYQRHELRRCLEDDHKYALFVWWDTLEDHTQGFRGSPEYGEWRALLHHFYDPFPTVEHYERVLP